MATTDTRPWDNREGQKATASCDARRLEMLATQYLGETELMREGAMLPHDEESRQAKHGGGER